GVRDGCLSAILSQAEQVATHRCGREAGDRAAWAIGRELSEREPLARGCAGARPTIASDRAAAEDAAGPVVGLAEGRGAGTGNRRDLAALLQLDAAARRTEPFAAALLGRSDGPITTPRRATDGAHHAGTIRSHDGRNARGLDKGQRGPAIRAGPGLRESCR